MSALREQILNASDIEHEDVVVPEWGGCTIRVRGMTGAQRNRFLNQAFDVKTGKPKFDRFHAAIIIETCTDPASGEPIFEAADREILNSKSAGVTERLAKTALRLSGLDDAESGKGDSDGESDEPTS
jgi:hypothetical protein